MHINFWEFSSHDGYKVQDIIRHTRDWCDSLCGGKSIKNNFFMFDFGKKVEYVQQEKLFGEVCVFKDVLFLV